MKARRFTALQLSIVVLILALIIFVKAYIPQLFSSISSTPLIRSNRFVTRAGTQLMLDGHSFRFAGANMPWLPFGDSTNYTSQFQINDGLDTAKEMGLTVIRAHDLGISTGCPNCIEPSLEVFNQTALEHDDYVISAAARRGLRLIIPLTDNYHYPAGGKYNFTDWLGISDENQFYSNPQVISEFETYISTLLNHVNVYTRVAYKDDPTILAWETGNELTPPSSWTQTISTYIKSIDHNHLIVDGRYGIDPNASSFTNIDIVSDHYYPKSISSLTTDTTVAKKIGKAFIVGEFDWNDANGGDSLVRFLTVIESNVTVTGDAYWELWPHDDAYGFVHGEVKYMLHYPGDSAAMRTSIQQLRTHAFNMAGLAVAAYSLPATPVLQTVVRQGTENVLLWRGAAGASDYSIERSAESANGPWKIICNQCATDITVPWTDATSPKGDVWYRVTAYNLSGVASSPSHPYQAGSAKMLVDDLDDWSKSYAHSSNLTFSNTYSQYMHGDISRVVRTTATREYIIWKEDNIGSFQAIAYFWQNESVSHFSIYTSSDGSQWTFSNPQIFRVEGEWDEYIYTLNNMVDVNYVKLVWNNIAGQPWSPQLGTISILE